MPCLRYRMTYSAYLALNTKLNLSIYCITAGDIAQFKVAVH